MDLLRMAGDRLMGWVKDRKEDAQEFLDTVKNQGLISVPAPTPEVRTALGYAKSVAGPLGRPFRIEDNQKSSDFYQQTIDAATYDPKERRLTYNQNVEDREKYDELGGSLSNKDFGRYNATVAEDGTVRVDSDVYDTNRDNEWHMQRVRDPGVSGRERVASAASILHNSLGPNWTNPYPYGENPVIGTFTPPSSPTAEEPVAAAPNPPSRPTSPEPDSGITVKAGDTLGAIARAQGLSTAYLAQVNNLDNPDLIRVGQKLKLRNQA